MVTITEDLYDRDDASGEKYVKDHITAMRRLLRKLKYVDRKKTQKTPKREIKRAKEERDDYKARKEAEKK